ncbi:hypothetical protein BKA63DRAFT_217512 [Paraphoma chrysanthemicola]|nr:hypothetical protein BKA63DRAFT_217512 [Paraphoma chrysanthemicola]
MPSQPPDSGWNFSPVFDLIDSNVHDIGSPTLRPKPRLPLVEGGVGLGNFGKLFETLGFPAPEPLPPLDESELSNSDDALLPSPLLEATRVPAERVVDTEPQSQDEVKIDNQDAGLTKKQRRKARREAERIALQREILQPQETLKSVVQASSKHNPDAFETPTKPPRAQSNVGAKIRPSSPVPAVDVLAKQQASSATPRPALHHRSRSSAAPATPKFRSVLPSHTNVQFTSVVTPAPIQKALAPQHLPQLQSPQIIAPVSHGLVPRNVRPVTLPRHSHPAVVQSRMPATPSPLPFPPNRPGYVTPLAGPAITIRSRTDRHMHLFEKLLLQFPDERKWLVAPRQLINENTTSEGLHVFVDASNIMIGFKDMLRNNGVQPYDMSFDSLALLMERRRPVAKRVSVGSHREANPLPHVTKLFETSKAVGYECNVQEQVFIAREESSKKKFFNDVNKLGWQKAIQKRSGSGSDSETGAGDSKTPSAPKWVEQGVDELLHLKMCQSLLDTEVPSTMVLATGDGAEAEMSDGFLAHVERALRKGWKVELVTWRQQTNGGYKRRAFRQKWGEQFTILELDNFLEDLIDTP